MYYSRILEVIDKTNREIEKLYKDIDFFIYNPAVYALSPFLEYLKKGKATRDVIFLGMNPGPFGMMQNGIPFGTINFVKSYLHITKDIDKSLIKEEHGKYKILGLDIERKEISGSKLWGLIEEVYPKSEDFLENQIVLNYCQIAILDKEKGRNITPDKLKKATRDKLEELCDNQLRNILDILEAKILVGIGAYATKALERVATKEQRVIRINHPSPLNARYFKTWTEDTKSMLFKEGIWN